MRSNRFLELFGNVGPALPSSLILSPGDFRSAGAGNPITAWVNTGSSTSPKVITSPNRTMTADKLVEDSANALHRILQDVTASGLVSHTWRVFAKGDERTAFWLVCQDNAAGNGGQAKFDLTVGTNFSATTFGLGSAASSSIKPFRSGWYLCSLTVTCGSGTAVRMAMNMDNGSGTTYTGNGTSGLYLWGASIDK